MDFNINQPVPFDQRKTDNIATHYHEIIKLLGENPEREGLLKTPERVSKAMQFLMNGYDQDPEEILRAAMFTEDYRQMVIVKDIDFYSMCEHHMLPFFGKVHVAYISQSQKLPA
jgi:GTP cyclohydrolase I